MSHTRRECEHGIVIAQCRCLPSGHMPRRLEINRPCPFGTAHLGMTVVHPLPPAAAIGPGLGQVPVQPAVPVQEPLDGAGGGAGLPPEDLNAPGAAERRTRLQAQVDVLAGVISGLESTAKVIPVEAAFGFGIALDTIKGVHRQLVRLNEEGQA